MGVHAPYHYQAREQINRRDHVHRKQQDDLERKRSLPTRIADSELDRAQPIPRPQDLHPDHRPLRLPIRPVPNKDQLPIR